MVGVTCWEKCWEGWVRTPPPSPLRSWLFTLCSQSVSPTVDIHFASSCLSFPSVESESTPCLAPRGGGEAHRQWMYKARVTTGS